MLTLGTAIKSLKAAKRDAVDSVDEELITDAIKAMKSGLKECDGDSDCAVARIHALGNAACLEHTINVLEKNALDITLRRESVAAMKAIRDSIEIEMKHLGAKIIQRLRLLVAKVAFESKQESTSRIIASEIITNYLDDGHLSQHLVSSMKNFNNNEMTTMIWNRALKQANQGNSQAELNNWHMHSNFLNGSSAYFSRTMTGTESVNATYAVNIELMSKGKLLKESAFDFALGNENKTESIVSVGLFARGMSSFAGGGDTEGADDESTMAGMSLKVLGVQMRPYIFFSGTGELMGHVWSGTGSEPMTAYRANLLLADYEEGYPLINGFIAEQKLKGVLTLDLSGEITVSLWNRNSHAVVRTKAGLLMQGSQTILTSDVTTMAAQKFTFGGATSVDTTTDTDFYSTPFKMCVQLEQPEFIVR